MICDKIAYENYKAANDVVRAFALHKKKKLRVYRCNDCLKFHVATVRKPKLKPVNKKYPLKINTSNKHERFAENGKKILKPEQINHATYKMIDKKTAQLLKGKIKLQHAG